MVFKVVWTGPARTEVREIKDYVGAVRYAVYQPERPSCP